MLNIPQLEEAMITYYPSSINKTTQHKRKSNIAALWELIGSTKDEHDLQYGESECRLEIFHTAAGETISIQFPGKESIEAGSRLCPFDFRPKIKTASGVILRDFVFKDMWGLIEHLNREHHNMLKIIATLFFQMGRMTNHEPVSETYRYTLIDNTGCEISSYQREITWNKLCLNEEVIESLNFHIPTVTIDDNTTISVEAFIYFFDMILQNEDSKYYYKKNNLSSGRIPTSDSMLLLVSHFCGHTSLSTLLQRYVSGFGVGKCLSSEIEPATDGLVKIVNRRDALSSLLTTHNIDFMINRTITVEGYKISTALKTNSPKVAILSEADTNKTERLESKGWIVFDFESALSSEYYQRILNTYGL